MLSTWQEKAATLVALRNEGGREPGDPNAAKQLLANPTFRTVVAPPDEAAANATDKAAAIEKLLADAPLGTDRPLFRLFAYHPDTVVDAVMSRIACQYTWPIAVNLYEAWWRLAVTGRLAAIEPRGQRTATAYLARTRWMLYSLPFRYGPASGIDSGEIPDVAGSQARLITRARQARQDWLDVLGTVEDHPLLLGDIDPESEVRALLDHPVNARRLAAEPSSGRSFGTGDATDQEVWRHLVRLHLLPRFAVGAAWKLAWRLSDRCARGLTIVAAVLFVTAITTLWWGASRWTPRATPWLISGATVAAGLGYAALAAASIRERAASWPWLLRQPASATLGVVALVALHPNWWDDGSPARAGAAIIVLVALASGYLAVEASNHRVPGGWTLLRRVSAVAGSGAVHAALIATVAVRWLAPAVSESGSTMDCLWSVTGCGTGDLPLAYVIGVATAWCYAAGVFSQILWDDQPYTAPLAHLRWRQGR